MSLFNDPVAGGEHASPMWVSQCHIYYSDKHGVVAAVHGDVSGKWSSEGEPMMRFGIGDPEVEIGQAVIRSLRGSRTGLCERDAESLWRAFPGFLGESDWSGIEQRWEMISVTWGEGGESVVRIYPMHRYETGGWIIQEGDPYRCGFVADEIGRVVSRIVSEPLPPIRA